MRCKMIFNTAAQLKPGEPEVNNYPTRIGQSAISKEKKKYGKRAKSN